MIVYFKCLCRSRDRLAAQKYMAQGYKIVETNKQPSQRAEALSHGLRLPIVVDSKGARPLYE